MRFHIVSGPQQLSALVTATDELIVITEGLFADGANVAALLEGTRPVVLALPDDGAVAEGFERLDINNAAAGLMRIPGSLVERLHDLPPDCDAASALTRVALQAGAQMRKVPPEARQGGSWRMVRSESEALSLEAEWLRARLNTGHSLTLSDRVSRMGVLAFGASLLHAGNASGATSIGAIVALVLSLGSAWLESPVLAFALAALGWVLVRATDLLRNAERQAYSVVAPAIPRADALGWLVDASLVVICILAVPMASEFTPFGVGDRIFAPVMLILMVHLIPRLLQDGMAAWACDRGVLALALGLAAGVGYLGPVVRLLALGLTVAGILLPPRRLN
jgi:hypothetical protein